MPEGRDAAGSSPPGWGQVDLASLAEQPQDASERPEGELGRVIKGKYKIIEQIGAGGMAVVYRAEEQGLIRRDVAIKLLKSESAVSQAMLTRFMKEAQAIAGITHPNVVQLFEIDRTPEGQIYLVMERLTGKTLHHVLRDMQEAGEVFSWENLAPLMLQACKALQAIHRQKIVHRDIKPSNLFCCGVDDEDWHLKVLDFGIAKTQPTMGSSPDSMATPLTQDGMFVGTPHFAAPEVIRQSPAIDERADIFALGVIMYQCLTGTLPLQGEHQDRLTVLFRTLNERPPSPRERAPERDIPPQVDAIVMKAMASEPGERFANAAALAEAIRATVRTTLPGNSARKPQIPATSPETTPGPPGQPVAARDPAATPAPELAPSSTPPLFPASDQTTPRPPGAPVPSVGSPTAVQELRPRTAPAILIAVGLMSAGLVALLLLFVYEATSTHAPVQPKNRPTPPAPPADTQRTGPPKPSLPPKPTSQLRTPESPPPEPAPQPQPQVDNEAVPPVSPGSRGVVEDPRVDADDGTVTPSEPPTTHDSADEVRKRKSKAILEKVVKLPAADVCLPFHLAVADGIYDEFPIKLQIDPSGKAKASASTRAVKHRLDKTSDTCLLGVIEAQSFPEGEGTIVVYHTLRFD